MQFHPESILTTEGSAGHQVIANVLRLCRERCQPHLVSSGLAILSATLAEPQHGWGSPHEERRTRDLPRRRPQLDYEAIASYLREVGGESWLERLDRGGLDGALDNDPQNLAEFAGKLCYRSWEPGLNPNVKKSAPTRRSIWRTSCRPRTARVLEHVSFTFVLHNCSRVLTHELVRHRPGTAISQESLRFVRLADIPFWFPEWARQDAELMKRATAVLEQLEEFQLWMASHFGLDEDGVPFHEKKHKTSFMRRFAPEGVATGLLWTANIRTLRHTIEAQDRSGGGGGDPAGVRPDRRADAGRGARAVRRLRGDGRHLDPQVAQGLSCLRVTCPSLSGRCRCS